MLAQAAPGIRILVSANTNVAVDRILNGLVDRDFDALARVGSMKKIDPRLLKFAIHCRNDSSKDAWERGAWAGVDLLLLPPRGLPWKSLILRLR